MTVGVAGPSRAAASAVSHASARRRGAAGGRGRDGRRQSADRHACTNPDLFWGLKGGGGGSLGIVTRLTLKTHELPQWFGGAFVTVKASSDDAFRRLIGRFMTFYRDSLFNPNWGEQVKFRPDNTLDIAMVFQSLDQNAAAAVWKPFFDAVAASPQDFTSPHRPWSSRCRRASSDADFYPECAADPARHRPNAPGQRVLPATQRGGLVPARLQST
jgi:hypothetical protein